MSERAARSKSVQRRLVGSPEWETCLRESHVSRRVARMGKLRVRSNDIPELVSICESGTTDERALAMAMLMGAAREGKIPAPEKRRWIELAARAMENEYPHTRVGRSAFGALLENDREALKRFVTELQLEGLNDDDLGAVVSDIARLRDPIAMTRLRDIAEMGGRVGENAARVLAGRGFVSREDVDGLARQWRDTHQGSVLNRLYHVYISHLRPGTASLNEIRELLGAPLDETARHLFYETKGVSLLVHGDERGYVKAFKMGGGSPDE